MQKKQPKNMRLLYLFIIITSLFACTSETKEPDINGHWHLHHFSDKDTLTYLKLDIKNDTVATLEGINAIKFGSPVEFLSDVRNVNEKKQTMMLRTQGAYERFEYEISNDTLFLREPNTQRDFDFYGLRKAPNTCDFWDDRYSDSSVKIELEEVGASDEIIAKKESIPFNIHIGIDKIKGTPAIEINGQIINTELHELPLAFEQFKATLRPSDKDTWYVAIDKHKNIPSEFAKKLTAKLDSISAAQVYYRKVTKDNEIVLTKQSLK